MALGQHLVGGTVSFHGMPFSFYTIVGQMPAGQIVFEQKTYNLFISTIIQFSFIICKYFK
jgi:hypothetical protein